MCRDKVVISIGGSILIPGDEDAIFIRQLAQILTELNKEVQMVVICGGGKIARYYTEVSSDLGASMFQQDILGIGITRQNAGLLALALGDLSSTDIPLTAEKAAKMSVPGKIIVMGGTEPGHTTDAVAAMVAKEMKADRVINATSVDAVYTADPKKDHNAKRLSRISIKELGELVYKDHGAGKSSVFDPLGVQIAENNNIDILMVDGRDLSDLKDAILGKDIKGTFINSH